MIKASLKPGTYPIVQLAQTQQFLYSAQKTIANIVVEDGPPVTMGLPAKLPRPTREYPLIRPEEIVARRTFVFADAFPGVQNPVVGIDFTINKAQYHEEQVHTRVQLGTAEEWTLAVPDKAQGGSEGHPFHIHVNSFEVIEANGERLPPGTIKDTVWIQQNSKVVMRTRFQQFVGKTVFHCHILPHEDTGMMHNFIIQREPVTKAGELDPSDWPICRTQPG
jgi:FtsP/CotA-like multicopper oxidase with cupredoxin domain